MTRKRAKWVPTLENCKKALTTFLLSQRKECKKLTVLLQPRGNFQATKYSLLIQLHPFWAIPSGSHPAGGSRDYDYDPADFSPNAKGQFAVHHCAREITTSESSRAFRAYRLPFGLCINFGSFCGPSCNIIGHSVSSLLDSTRQLAYGETVPVLCTREYNVYDKQIDEIRNKIKDIPSFLRWVKAVLYLGIADAQKRARTVLAHLDKMALSVQRSVDTYNSVTTAVLEALSRRWPQRTPKWTFIDIRKKKGLFRTATNLTVQRYSSVVPEYSFFARSQQVFFVLGSLADQCWLRMSVGRKVSLHHATCFNFEVIKLHANQREVPNQKLVMQLPMLMDYAKSFLTPLPVKSSVPRQRIVKRKREEPASDETGSNPALTDD